MAKKLFPDVVLLRYYVYLLYQTSLNFSKRAFFGNFLIFFSIFSANTAPFEFERLHILSINLLQKISKNVAHSFLPSSVSTKIVSLPDKKNFKFQSICYHFRSFSSGALSFSTNIKHLFFGTFIRSEVFMTYIQLKYLLFWWKWKIQNKQSISL